MSRMDLLQAIVTSAGEQVATDFSASYRGERGRDAQTVAQCIDTLISECIEYGLLEADDHTSGVTWKTAVEDIYGTGAEA